MTTLTAHKHRSGLVNDPTATWQAGRFLRCSCRTDRVVGTAILTLTTHQSERGCFLTKRHNFKEGRNNFKEGRTSLSTIGALPSWEKLSRRIEQAIKNEPKSCELVR
jgi:hypothetical protein